MFAQWCSVLVIEDVCGASKGENQYVGVGDFESCFTGHSQVPGLASHKYYCSVSWICLLKECIAWIFFVIC